MPIIINPGTEGRSDATLENAERIVDAIAKDLGLPRDAITRNVAADDGGRFGFQFTRPDCGICEIEVPGDPPEEFLASIPFTSRRMYVDGSSWLYKYGIGIMAEALGVET